MLNPTAYEGNEPYVFVSYDYKDAGRVLPIISALQQRGVRIWYGTEADDQLECLDHVAQRLQDCAGVLGILTESAVNCHNFKQQINYAIDRRKDITVAVLEDVQLSLGMQMQLSTVNLLYFSSCCSYYDFLEQIYHGMNAVIQQKQAEKASAEATRKAKEAAESKAKEEQQRLEKEKANKYLQDANRGIVDAQCAIASCYEQGRGVPQDLKEAYKWHRRAAEQGDAYAQQRLGKCYSYGYGVLCDYAEAVKWYLKAANQDDTEAMFQLGLAYELGMGVPQSRHKAIKWYMKAIDRGGHFGARERMRGLSAMYRRFGDKDLHES